MPRVIRLLPLLSLAFSLCLLSAYAQWVPTNGPYGGSVVGLSAFTTPTGGVNLIAGTWSNNLFRSSNNGTTWREVRQGPTLSTFSFSFVGTPDGRHLFAGNWNGILHSTDAGASWSEVYECPDTVFAGITSLALGGNGTYLYAANVLTVLFSTNYGVTWTDVGAGLQKKMVSALAVNGTRLYAGTYDGGVFVTTDNGTVWSQINNGLTDTKVGTFAISPDMEALFVATRDSGVFCSTDNGVNWVHRNEGLSGLYVASLLATHGEMGMTYLFAGTDSGLFVSSNRGTTWERRGLASFNIPSLAVAPEGTEASVLLAGTYRGGVFRSSDNGFTWTQANTGMTDTRVTDFVSLGDGPNGTDLFALTEVSGVFRSTDGGASWNLPSLALAGTYVLSLAVDSLPTGDIDLYAGTHEKGVLRSTDRGVTWTPMNAGLSPLVWYYVHTTLAVTHDTLGLSHLYAGFSERGLFVSTDRGVTWDSVNTGLTNWAVSCFAAHPNKRHLFAGTANGVFLTTNYGATWTERDSGLTDKYVRTLAFSPDGGKLFVGTNDGVSVTTDQGVTWSSTGALHGSLSGQLPIGSILVIPEGTNGFNLVAASIFYEGGVFLSTNAGANWIPVQLGLTDPYVLSLVTTSDGSNRYILAGTSRSGVWRRPLVEMTTGVKEDAQDLPTGFALEQNYPNPFNPSTTIGYSLSHRSHVTLTVFNTLGQQVATLVDGDLAPGYHTVQFDGSQLASGVYLYRLQAGSFVDMKKLLLLR